MYHRPTPMIRSDSSTSVLLAPVADSNGPSRSHSPTPRLSPLLPTANLPAYPLPNHLQNGISIRVTEPGLANNESSGPTLWGMPLKYVSLITLAVQNASLAIVMHYSRVSTPANKRYSPATAVLLNEILKGIISLAIALLRIVRGEADASLPAPRSLPSACVQVTREIFSPDCWKLSIPALLYVVQNSLQFVAVSNLDVATFQVSYQMKILTTAAFSVALLRRSLSPTKWAALFFLALGVAIVQLQNAGGGSTPPHPHHHAANDHHHPGGAPDHYIPPPQPDMAVTTMNPLRGFGAVVAACFTSGLAGVYFEMVLKNSRADLWVRNVQLSLFSLLPAVLPILFPGGHAPRAPASPEDSGLFAHFGFWAWATVAIQVAGGLVTAVVIKYSDNILKGFATSLSIVLSFLASVVLFDFGITPSFLLGASTVLGATWMYNQPDDAALPRLPRLPKALSRAPTPSPRFSPVRSDEPIIGEPEKKRSTPFGSPRAVASALGLGLGVSGHGGVEKFGQTLDTARYLSAPYGSPFGSPLPSRAPSPQPPPMRSNGLGLHLSSGQTTPP